MPNFRKSSVTVSALRQNHAVARAEVKKGREIVVTSRGRVIARIVVGGDPQQEASERLRAIRRHCTVGDLLRPSGAQWDAER